MGASASQSAGTARDTGAFAPRIKNKKKQREKKKRSERNVPDQFRDRKLKKKGIFKASTKHGEAKEGRQLFYCVRPETGPRQKGGRKGGEEVTHSRILIKRT